MKNGLVLEGGAMRGMFTAGVLDVFMEEGIEFDGAVGTSAGATFGCNIKSRQPRRAIRYNVRYGKDKRYASFKNLILTGDYFSRGFCYRDLPFILDPFDLEAYQKNPMKFYVCATDIETGKPVYFDSKTGDAHDVEWIRASASMPLFSTIVKLDGYKLLDGGVTDSIPLRFMEKKGYEKNVVVLTNPATYHRKKNPLLPVLKVVYKDYPKMIKAMEERHIVYNRQIAYIRTRERAQSVFVIQPPRDLNISRIEHEPKELLRVYKIGRREAKVNLDRIRQFLSKNS